MPAWTTRLLVCCTLLFAAWCGVFSIAMISQLADAADRLHAGAGLWVFWGLLACLAASVLLPTLWLLRLPAALRYPDDADLHATAAYQQRLRMHLGQLPRLSGLPLDSDDALHHAMEVLRSDAEAEIRRTAGAVLASTALLQNGKLDALVVLFNQVQLIWRIARIYGLRPSLRQISYLYGNVGACMLIASSLEDVDFAELTAPIVQSATPAALGSIPGLGSIGNLLTNSLASGAANAFLTLRIGLIATAYCAPEQAPQRLQVRQSSTRQAAQLLGSIVKDCGNQVTQAVYGCIKQGVLGTAQAAADSVKQAAHQVRQGTNAVTQRLRPKGDSTAS